MESLKAALERALKRRGIEGELKGWDAVREWPRVVGPRIASHTRAVRFHQGALEVQVEVFSEETLTGKRQLTSRAFLTFVAIDRDGQRIKVPPLLVENDEERRVCEEAHRRRDERLRRRDMAKG